MDDEKLIAEVERELRGQFDYATARISVANLRRVIAHLAALQARVEELVRKRMLAEADAAHAAHVWHVAKGSPEWWWYEDAIARHRARPASAPGDAGEESADV